MNHYHIENSLKIGNWKLIISALLFFALWNLSFSVPTHALSLKAAPLLYEETLTDGEKKKGFIDISNPNDQTVRIETEIQAFRQINDNGDLEFIDRQEYSQGVQLDYDDFILEPREALRLYFLLDADKLPEGGVYASIFFRTTLDDANPDNTSIQPATRVGTLLVIENGGGSEKNASVEDVRAPRFQFSETITATALVKNTNPEDGLAFFSELTAHSQPFGAERSGKAPLAFPGITRKAPIKLKGHHFGPVRITVGTGDSSQSIWVLAATGHGRWAGLLATVLLIATIFVMKYRHKLPNFPRKR